MTAAKKNSQKGNWRWNLPGQIAFFSFFRVLFVSPDHSLGVTWLEKSHENAVKDVNKACGRDKFLNGCTCQYIGFSSNLE